jgi:hypothetical protein
MELEKALSERMNKTGRYYDSNKEPHPLNLCCGYVGISYNTMIKYVRGNSETRRTLICGVGTKCLVESKEQKFLVDIMLRKDCADGRLAMSEGIDLVQDVLPRLSRTQAQRIFVKMVQVKH